MPDPARAKRRWSRSWGRVRAGIRIVARYCAYARRGSGICKLIERDRFGKGAGGGDSAALEGAARLLGPDSAP
ncbi:hypothetical protein GCM10009590_14670 [Brachybacterium alimentarium]